MHKIFRMEIPLIFILLLICTSCTNPKDEEKAFKFNGGRIIVFYGYKDSDEFSNKIHGTLAEIDFNYTPLSESMDDFHILFIPNTNDKAIFKKVEQAFTYIRENKAGHF